MKHRHRVSCLAALFLGGCVIRFGPIDDTGAGGDGASSSTSGTPDAELTRQAEVDEYISEIVYQGGTVTRSIQLPSGDIIDGIDRATLPALEDVTPATPWDPSALQLPPGVELGLADIIVGFRVDTRPTSPPRPPLQLRGCAASWRGGSQKVFLDSPLSTQHCAAMRSWRGGPGG